MQLTNYKIVDISKCYEFVIKKLKRDNDGICDLIGYLHDVEKISTQDYIFSLEYFIKNKPSETLHLNFYCRKCYVDDLDGYWWQGYGSKKQRILFMQMLIKQLYNELK